MRTFLSILVLLERAKWVEMPTPEQRSWPLGVAVFKLGFLGH